MDYLQKVLWSEGMFLTPHHFQQWDRYYDNLLQQRFKSLESLGWGACRIEINEDALSNGEFILGACSAVLPDGLAVDVPNLDRAPNARPVGDVFDPKKDFLGVYLASPLARPGTASCNMDGATESRPTRFQKQPITITDGNTGSNDRQIEAASKDLRILFDTEPLDDFARIKIAEVERTATGTFALRKSYIPPSLYASASPWLIAILRRIIEILSTKCTELSGQRRSRAQGLVEFTMSEAAGFWLLHTVNAGLPPLLHCFQRPDVHPERVYLELARMTGQLYTFATEGHPKDIPPYKHEDLRATFEGLEQTLRRLLETVIATRCTPIPLQKVRENLYSGAIHDEPLLETAQFYLAVMANVPEDKVAREIPLKAKISSLDRVDRLIAAALRGLAVRHKPTPPGEIPVQPGRTYFHVDKSGEHWDAVKTSRAIAIYVPPEFTDLKLELMAVKE